MLETLLCLLGLALFAAAWAIRHYTRRHCPLEQQHHTPFHLPQIHYKAGHTHIPYTKSPPKDEK